MAVPPPRGNRERWALIIAIALIAIVLVIYLNWDAGLTTAPTVSDGGQEPGTAAPYGVEPTQPMVQPNDP